MVERFTGLEADITAEQKKFSEYWQWATQARDTFMYLRTHPFCPDEELKQASGLIYNRAGYPELTQYVKIMLQRRRQVTKVQEAFRIMAPKDAQTYPMAVCEALLWKRNHLGEDRDFKPKGRVTASGLSNPFAICIIVDHEDFVRLHSNEGTTGYFEEQVNMNVNHVRRRFPVICINRDKSPDKRRTLVHEERHAAISIAELALRRTNNGHLWEGGSRMWEGHRRTLGSLKRGWDKVRGGGGNDEERIMRTEAFAQVVRNVRANFKDEIIVRLMTGQGMSGIVLKDGNYDWTKKRFKGYENLRDLVWDEAARGMQFQTDVANGIESTYKQAELFGRAELFPWMLIRMPMDQWDILCQATGVKQEAEAIQSVLTSANRLAEARMFLGRDVRGIHMVQEVREAVNANGSVLSTPSWNRIENEMQLINDKNYLARIAGMLGFGIGK